MEAKDLHLASEDTKFECKLCGLCCSYEIRLTRATLERIIPNSPEWGSKITPILEKIGPDGISSLFSKNGRIECLFLKGNLCSINIWKPIICKLYPFFPIPSFIVDDLFSFINGAVKVRSEISNKEYYISYDENCPGVGAGTYQDWSEIVRLWEEYQEEIADLRVKPELYF